MTDDLKKPDGPQEKPEYSDVDSGLLSGMSYEDAKDYVLRHVTTEQQLRKEIGEIEENLSKWQKRLELAAASNREELVSQAQEQVTALKEKKQTIEFELFPLETDIPRMKKELQKLAAFKPQVNATMLNEALENLVGKDTIVEEKVKKELLDKEVDDELAALKKRLQNE